MPTYKLVEAGCHYDTIEADSLTAALDVARDAFDADVYRGDSTTWIDVRVVNVADPTDAETVTICVDPRMPPCPGSKKHHWQLRSHRGHGGGVLIEEACVRCGCGCTTNTWACRPDTGQQGLVSVSFEPERYPVLEPGD